ncbi:MULTISPECIES: hypothetical protein [unclassified Duganella]|uniref:hypothetical protein n=1 Tax=unclassified Duganella TaxID=2636909 RepID=UPI0008885F06|nr:MULTISPECIES: hypothetical protein [unclassified Duganella]SDG84978.1 hypothetical protein SAMN05216320_107285 [Duganella sp. OV458]SDK12384.1 hypothetical protein SAMN05428973_108286 [Duganella sp. OV510]
MKPQNAPQIIPKFIPVITGFLLAGCASMPVPITQRVDVPVPVPCVKAADVPKRPDYAAEKLTPTASDGEKVLALASDWPRGRKYEAQLEAVIAGCR